MYVVRALQWRARVLSTGLFRSLHPETSEVPGFVQVWDLFSPWAQL